MCHIYDVTDADWWEHCGSNKSCRFQRLSNMDVQRHSEGSKSTEHGRVSISFSLHSYRQAGGASSLLLPCEKASVTLPRGPGLGPSPRHWLSLARRECVFANRSPAPVVPVSAKLSSSLSGPTFVCRLIAVLAVNLEGMDFTQHLPATLATRKKMCHCPATYLSFPNTSLHRPLKRQSSKQ